MHVCGHGITRESTRLPRVYLAQDLEARAKRSERRRLVYHDLLHGVNAGMLGFRNGRRIGIGSLVPGPREHAPHPTSWRMRAMAVVENMRGTGVGSNILQVLIDHMGRFLSVGM